MEELVVTWDPFVELREFMEDRKSLRFSYYNLVDTPVGETIMKQLAIDVENWQRKFKFLKDLPFEATPEECMNFFKKVAEKNAVYRMVTTFTKETRDVFKNAHLEKHGKDIAAADIEKDTKDLI